MSELIFDPSTHTYTLRGQRLLSVTQVIDAAGLIDKQWFTDEHRLRGTAVHEAVLYDVQSDLDKTQLHELIAGYVEGWFAFKRDSKFVPIKKLCEKPQFHPLYLYAGTADLFGMLNSYPALIDIKTGDSPTAGIQTSAYVEFPVFKAYTPKRFTLRLYKEGTYKLIQHTDKTDFPKFMECLKIAR